MATAEYENILTEVRGKVAIITLHRPKALNALCSPLIEELNGAAHAFDADKNIGAIIITGSDKAFAAGADIKEMATKSFVDAYKSNMFANWGTSPRSPSP
ncbi:ClpP/crotonase-like domain [Phytophthora cactorum]|nr:ClpP/crotonase-like domain [Phytophthora cactorum]